MEKFGHIKNPLSVIAIFAGFAEVAGTLILPKLDVSTQHIYVWFLMFFPLFLVSLFFATLNWNHTVLYAPSDFKDEKLFRQLVKANSRSVEDKLDQEVEEATAEVAASQSFDEPSEPDVSPPVEEAADETQEQVAGIDMTDGVEALRRKASLAQRLAIDHYEMERKILLLRKVSPEGRPDLVFDAATWDPRERTVVEVKYTHRGHYPISFLRQTLNRVGAYRETLPPEVQNGFKFVLILVLGKDFESRRHNLRVSVSKALLEQDIPFELVIYNYEDLKREFI